MTDIVGTHCCDHQCTFHRFKTRAVGEGDKLLLITYNEHTMVATYYLMPESECSRWCGLLRDVDMVKFEGLLMSGLTLEQALEALS